jgi:protein TonB
MAPSIPATMPSMQRLGAALILSSLLHVGLALLALTVRPAAAVLAPSFVEVASIASPAESQLTAPRPEPSPPPQPEQAPEPRRRVPRRAAAVSHRLPLQDEQAPEEDELAQGEAEEEREAEESAPASGEVSLTESQSRAPRSVGVGSGPQPRGAARRRRAPPGRNRNPCRASLAAVHSGLSSLDYPGWLRDLALAGTVRISMRIGRDGRPRGVRLTSSSGQPALDRHAMSAVRRLRDIPTCSRAITVPVQYEMSRR